MNREYRRKNGIISQKREFTDVQLKAFIDKGVEVELARIRNEIFQRYLYVTCMSLHDEFNFGKIRLTKMMEKIQLTLKCISEGRTSVQDIKKWMHDKYDISLITKYGEDNYESTKSGVNNSNDERP